MVLLAELQTFMLMGVEGVSEIPVGCKAVSSLSPGQPSESENSVML